MGLIVIISGVVILSIIILLFILMSTGVLNTGSEFGSHKLADDDPDDGKVYEPVAFTVTYTPTKITTTNEINKNAVEI